MVVSSDFAMTDSDGKTIDLNVVQKSRPESGTADLADRHDKDQGTQREIARLPGLFEEAFSTKRVREEFLYEKMSLALMWTPIPMMEELRKELAKAARPFGNMVTLHNTRRAFVNNIMQEGVKQGTHLYQKIGTVTYDFRDPRSASRGLIQGARDLKHGDFGSVDFKDIVAVVIAPDDGYVQEHLAKIRDNLETYGYSWNTDFWWEPVRAIHAVDLSLTDAELEAIKAQVEEFAGRHADEAAAHSQEAGEPPGE